MGISHGTIAHYCQLLTDGHLAETMNVLDLGRQQLTDLFFLHPEPTELLCKLFHKPSFFTDCSYTPAVGNTELSDIIHDECPFADVLFRHLGVEYEAIDMVDGCTKMNLNCDSVPEEKVGHFSLVTNYGTTEHLINQENAFKVVHDFTAAGGVMIHELPYQGYFQHGFFGYTTTFFSTLAEYNDYDIIQMDLNFCDPRPFVESTDEFKQIQKYGTIRNLDINANLFMDAGIYVALRKRTDRGFVTPLDLPDKSRASQEFYSSDFRPGYFQRIRSFLKRLQG